MRAADDSVAPTMKHPSENQSQEVLAGLVERVTYHNNPKRRHSTIGYLSPVEFEMQAGFA